MEHNDSKSPKLFYDWGLFKKEDTPYVHGLGALADDAISNGQGGWFHPEKGNVTKKTMNFKVSENGQKYWEQFLADLEIQEAKMLKLNDKIPEGQKEIRTAYGISKTCQFDERQRKQILSDVASRLTIRNSRAVEFSKELYELLNKYPEV